MSVIGKILVSLTGLLGVVGVSYYYYSQSKEAGDSSDSTIVDEGADDHDQTKSESEEKLEGNPSEEKSEQSEADPKQLEHELEPDMDDLEGNNLPDSIEDEEEEGDSGSEDKERARKRCGEPLDNGISKANLPTHGKNSLGRTYTGGTSCLHRNKFKSGIFS